jgi:hypothetical protein
VPSDAIVTTRRRTFIAALSIALLVGYSALVFAVARDDDAPKPHPSERQSVPLAPEARATAVEFIRTAVVRKHLRRAWLVSGRGIRQCLTLRQWMTGNIPVLPFPDADVSRSPVRIESSQLTSASLKVKLRSKSASIKPQVFYLDLVKRRAGSGSRWVVESWRAEAPVLPPSGPC